MSVKSSAPAPLTFLDPAAGSYSRRRRQHWNDVARRRPGCGGHYHRRLTRIYQNLVGPGLKVLEIGCGQGDLLAALQAKHPVGVDFSSAMLEEAARRHPELHLIQADCHELPLAEKFDVIILSDLVNDVWDVQAVLGQLGRMAHARTRIILNFYSRLWELPLRLVRRLGLARPLLEQNWLTRRDVLNLLQLSKLEPIHDWEEVLLPLPIPGIDPIFNRLLVRFWPLNRWALTRFVVARPRPSGQIRPESVGVSVIVPARNEAGNIAGIFQRTPNLGRLTELIFVDGRSSDGTCERIQEEMSRHPRFHCKLLSQKGEGKGDAVRQGAEAAAGEVLMILDADLTVPPECLPSFLEALTSGQADFANGVRLVYPMEDQAMRTINLWGNKFFSLVFSWLLGQPVQDTLCGTKALWRQDYWEIAAHCRQLGGNDPFGDFDLLLGAAKIQLKIMDIPLRYQARSYGVTKIRRWRHGWLLLKMVIFTARKVKFV